MKAICLFFSVSLCSWLGWELGASYGIMIAYWISLSAVYGDISRHPHLQKIS